MAERKRILVVEDDERVRMALSNLLEAWGYGVEVATDGNQGWEKIVSGKPLVVISDLRMPGLGGLELLRQARDFNPNPQFILLTGYGTISDAVEATKLGASNFLLKPVNPERLQLELRHCLEMGSSRRPLRPSSGPQDLNALGRLVGCSSKMQDVLSTIAMVAPTVASVLITGESGTGKELAARTIHQLSPFRTNPFVAVNCAAIPEPLIESELFGHEKGAFTGAIQQSMGCFELAQGGTLLLDEIAEMPPVAQAKLLRVLESSTLRRLGGAAEIPIATRVLASTNRVPEEAVKRGQLRGDLYYRLNVVHLTMPPLREHMEDLDPLTRALLEDLNRKHHRAVQSIDAAARDLMRSYRWPGNVRELRNVLERAVVTCTGDVITRRELPPTLTGEAQRPEGDRWRIVPGLSMAEVERRHILETLSLTSNNKTKAAAILGITVRTLQNKLKEYARAQSVQVMAPESAAISPSENR